MTPSKWILSTAAVAALVAAGVQWNLLSKLRLENQALVAAAPEADASRQPPDAEQLRQQDEELARLREETKSLARARNDIRQLRQQKPELDKLRAAHQQLLAAKQAGTNAPAAGYILTASMIDAGLASPEATCQTFLFASSRGNVHRAEDCMASDSEDTARLRARSGKEIESDRREMSEQFKGFPGFRVAERKIKSDTEVELGLQCAPGGHLMHISLQLFGNEWKVVDVR